MKPSPTRLRNPRKKSNPVSRAALLGAAVAVLAWPAGAAAQTAEEALKRPIAESNLLPPADAAGVAGKVEASAVPRAIPVNPRDYVPAPPPDPVPVLTMPTAPTPEKKSAGETVINSEEASFDNKKHLAIFLRSVTVDDPEFYLTCDKLTAFLKHDDANGEGAEPAAKSSGKGGLDRAIAEGHVVITQVKKDLDGKVASTSTAWAERADYDAKTGDIELTGMPIVQQDLNRSIATSPETVMTLNRDRNMRVKGPSRTTVAEKMEPEKKKKP